jgi:para-aminobenzoate synthetase component I
LTFEPLVKELVPAPSVDTCTAKLASLPGCLLLDSSMRILNDGEQPLGRYSFLMADPFQTIQIPLGSEKPFAEIGQLLNQYRSPTIPNLPPMQGGLAGFFSYDLNQSIENIEPVAHNEFNLPAIVLGAYDVVIAWDHQLNRAWLISHGFPETITKNQKERAQSRIEFFSSVLVNEDKNQPNDHHAPLSSGLALEEISNALDVDGPTALKSNFSKQNYIDTVQRCIDYIYAGDVFQINLSQRLLHPANCNSLELYRRLKTCNPSPFGGYFDISGISDCPAQIISASPERLCSVRDRIVETRPIKGTRRRTGYPMVDIQAREELLASEKDRAENTMIVDLMRNDLSIVCESDSVRVGQLCELEEYQSVLHLVSSVEGKLKPAKNLIDLVAAIFPGGSITGAPKVRAMEIIAELEPCARGAYCGSMGYLGFNGSADLNILIRTITASQGWWQIPVGGGIVSHSIPQKEYEETWTKAAGMLRAVTMDQAPA